MPRLAPLAIALWCGFSALPAIAQERDAPVDEAGIKALALEAIRENPEIILEALSVLEARQAEAQAAAAREVLAAEREAIERDPNAPVLGNPEGDVTVVEFLDYNCPHCRRTQPEVARLLEADPEVRLVIREWPILGEDSVAAARVALAAREQGAYAELHEALLRLPEAATAEAGITLAEVMGLDVERLRADMASPEVEEHLATSLRLADALGFGGTPAFVIGDALLPGAATAEELGAAVDAARRTAE